MLRIVNFLWHTHKQEIKKQMNPYGLHWLHQIRIWILGLEWRYLYYYISLSSFTDKVFHQRNYTHWVQIFFTIVSFLNLVMQLKEAVALKVILHCLVSAIIISSASFQIFTMGLCQSESPSIILTLPLFGKYDMEERTCMLKSGSGSGRPVQV